MSRPTKDDQPQRVRLSTRDLEDDLAYSTWSGRTPSRSKKRYVSIDHVLNWLRHFLHPAAIDVAGLAMPSGGTPKAEHFIAEQYELAELAEAVNEALEEAGDFRATVWARVRLQNHAYRTFRISKSKVGLIVGEVEGMIAQALKRREMWKSGEIRSEEHAVEPRHGKEEMA